MTDIAGSDRERSIRLRYKIIAHVAAWIIALLLTAPGMWPLAYMFPLGLVASSIATSRTTAAGVFSLAARSFISFTDFFISAPRTAVLYAVLVILLIGNVAGCREMIHSH
jgi:uncharacterized membrane protein